MSKLLWPLLILVAFSLAPFAQEQSFKDIDLDYLYKRDEAGVKPLTPHLPRSLQWSPEGHDLAYLVSAVTEAPHLVIYDPAEDATPYVVSPFAVHDAIIALASFPKGASIAVSKQCATVPDDATAIKKIDWFHWRKLTNDLRLSIEGKRYVWNFNNNLLNEETRPELPEGEKRDATDSPNERYAAYTRGDNIWAFDRDQKKEIQLTNDGGDGILNGRMSWVYWEEIHNRSSWRAFYWSPNNDRLAYLQFDERDVSVYPVTDFSKPVPKTREMRYPKTGTVNPTVRLGVVALSTRETRWVDLGEPYEYICSVEWLPDGETLAAQVMNRKQTMLRLLFVNLQTGECKTVLEETDDEWVSYHGKPYFLKKQDAFLWFSERSGFSHLYLYSNQGKLLRQLTRGEWDVDPNPWSTSFGVDEKNKRAYFVANKESPIEQRAYSVSFRGGAPRLLTKEPGLHNVNWSADHRFAVDTYSNTKTPRCIQIINHRGKTIRAMGERAPQDYAPWRIKSKEIVNIESPESLRYYASILKPFDFDPNKKYPVIVYVYGGPAGQVVQNRYTGAQDMAFVNQGYLYVGFDTRGTYGRGREWIEAIHKNAAEKPLQDLEMLVEYLKALPYVDGNRMGIWGWSNGGFMTCAAMLIKPGLFRAGAAVAPVTDWMLYDTIYTERYMGQPDENKDGYHNAAPVHFADGLQGSLLLAHGVSDDNVHIQNIYSLVDALIEANKEYKLYIYPQRAHGIGGDARRYHLFKRIFEFFDRELKQ